MNYNLTHFSLVETEKIYYLTKVLVYQNSIIIDLVKSLDLCGTTWTYKSGKEDWISLE